MIQLELDGKKNYLDKSVASECFRTSAYPQPMAK